MKLYAIKRKGYKTNWGSLINGFSTPAPDGKGLMVLGFSLFVYKRGAKEYLKSYCQTSKYLNEKDFEIVTFENKK